MKKATALICAIVLVCVSLVSCGGKAPDFIPIEKGDVVTVNWTYGAINKEIDKEKIRADVADAYNSVTGTKPYDPREVKHGILVVCGEGDGQSLYVISYLGDARFNVSVNGSATPNGGNIRYSVVNEDLEKIFNDELLQVEPVNVTADVKFVLAEGTSAPDGSERETDEVLYESKQDFEGSEAALPNLLGAVMQTLFTGDFAESKKISADGSKIEELNGYEETIINKEETADIYRWEYYLNGERVESGDASSVALNDGDEIVVKYVLRHPGE